MKRLRHPVRAIREPFGTAGLVVACVALIAALGGTALAAAKLNSTQKKEVEKIAKKVAKPGPAGAAGATGPAGPAGAAGKNGSDGTNGKDGTNGTNGTPGSPGAPGAPGKDGESVVPFPIDPGTSKCDGQGGVEYEVGEETTEVCNGKEGSPWTATGTLPPGATETGTWTLNAGVQKLTVEVEGVQEEVTVGDTGPIAVPISFPIPLENGLSEEAVHFGNQEEPGFHAVCAGTGFVPKAKPGELCIYTALGGTENTTLNGIYRLAIGGSLGASPVGAVLVFDALTENASASGTFAVTGCSATLPDGDPNKCP